MAGPVVLLLGRAWAPDIIEKTQWHQSARRFQLKRSSSLTQSQSGHGVAWASRHSFDMFVGHGVSALSALAKSTSDLGGVDEAIAAMLDIAHLQGRRDQVL